jgi:hypothetical protein
MQGRGLHVERAVLGVLDCSLKFARPRQRLVHLGLVLLPVLLDREAEAA